MGNAELIGRMTALLDLNERAVKTLDESRTQIAGLTLRLGQSARELDELRGLVGDLAEIAKRAKQHTWIGTTELAAELKVDPKTVRNWAFSGKLPYYRASEGGHMRFDRNEVAERLKVGGEDA